jgi:O-antigen/teichoic acid export membrane protein
MAWLDRWISEETRRFLGFGASSLALTVANMVGGILALRWVPPELMGPWQATLLLQTYCDFLKLGVLNGMNREFPFRMGQGDEAAAMRSLATTLAWLRIGSLLGLAAFAGLGVMNWDKGVAWQVAAIAGALQWVFAYYSNYVQATLRGGDDFARLSLIQYCSAAISLLLLPLVAFGGFTGFCSRAVLQAAIVSLMLRSVMRFRPPPALDQDEWRRLLLSGFPLFIASYLFHLGMNAERTALLTTGDDRLLGLFAPVAAVLSAVLVLPNAAALYLYPKLSRGLGKDADTAKLWDLAWRNSRVTAAVAAGVAVGAWLLAEPVTRAVFPAYLAAVPAMKWAAVSGIFLAFRPMSTALPALQAWSWHYIWVTAFVGVKIGLCFLFVQHFADPLVAVAQAGTIAAVLAAALILLGVSRTTKPAP